MLTVGQVARAGGVSAKAVRHYEARGLLPVATRTAAGYRMFDDTAVEVVRFVRRARALGLGLDAAAEILGARRDGRSPCGRTDELLASRIAEIDHTVCELRALRRTLVAARAACAAAPAAPTAGTVCPVIDNTTAAR